MSLTMVVSCCRVSVRHSRQRSMATTDDFKRGTMNAIKMFNALVILVMLAAVVVLPSALSSPSDCEDVVSQQAHQDAAPPTLPREANPLPIQPHSLRQHRPHNPPMIPRALGLRALQQSPCQGRERDAPIRDSGQRIHVNLVLRKHRVSSRLTFEEVCFRRLAECPLVLGAEDDDVGEVVACGVACCARLVAVRFTVCEGREYYIESKGRCRE